MKRFLQLGLYLAVAFTPFKCLADTDIICQLQPGTNPADVATAYGIRFEDKTPYAPFFLFCAPGLTGGDIEDQMNRDPRFVWVAENGEVQLGQPDVTSRGPSIPVIGGIVAISQLNGDALTQIGWDKAAAYQGKSTTLVAILDTGISPLAKELVHRVVNMQNQVDPKQPAWDLPDKSNLTSTAKNAGVGHGTMVAGLIAMISPNTKFVIEKVAGSDGLATAWSVIRGISDAASQGVNLCNISLGAPGQIPSFERVFEWALHQNMIVVAPIGNDNSDMALEPASLEDSICVAGLDSKNVRAPFSNFNARANVAAPAIGLASTYWDGRPAVGAGTSFACPLVTGAIAIALGNGTLPNVSRIRDALRHSGYSLDVTNPKFAGLLGSGLNIRSFLKYIQRSAKTDPDDRP